MKHKNLIFWGLSLIVFLFAILTIGITYGWFADVIDLGSGTVSVGDIRYTKSGEFISSNQIIQPGMELIDTPITLTNESSITSQMRVKIEYTKVTRPVDTLVIETVDYANSASDHLSVTFGSTFVYDNGYWYYNGLTSSIPADSGTIDVISSLYYDGNLVGNDYSGITCNISIVIEVKQNDNVSWSELTSYDFSTGNPA